MRRFQAKQAGQWAGIPHDCIHAERGDKEDYQDTGGERIAAYLQDTGTPGRAYQNSSHYRRGGGERGDGDEQEGVGKEHELSLVVQAGSASRMAHSLVLADLTVYIRSGLFLASCMAVLPVHSCHTVDEIGWPGWLT